MTRLSTAICGAKVVQTKKLQRRGACRWPVTSVGKRCSGPTAGRKALQKQPCHFCVQFTSYAQHENEMQ